MNITAFIHLPKKRNKSQIMSNKRINCWEYMKCGREPGGENARKLGICPAAEDTSYSGFNQGINAGRLCWLVAGTFCGGTVQGTFAEKSVSCRQCDFYRKVHAEEGSTIQSIDTMNIFAATHIGWVRKANEDRYLIKKLDDGAILLAVADGLHKKIATETMISLLKAETDLETKAKSLVEAALDSGGKDNITIVIAERS